MSEILDEHGQAILDESGEAILDESGQDISPPQDRIYVVPQNIYSYNPNQFQYKKINSTLDYGINWEEWLSLNNDTISTHNWDTPQGIDIIDESVDGALAGIKISGGEYGEIYTLKSKITTTAKALEECKPIYIKIEHESC